MPEVGKAILLAENLLKVGWMTTITHYKVSGIAAITYYKISRVTTMIH